jgi:hypothetical protein
MVQTAFITLTLLMPLTSARPEGLARIYVYVQRETPARSWLPISCDGSVVAKVKQGKFFAINVAPGRHMVSPERGIPVFIDVRSGSEAFVTVGWRNGERGGPAIPFLVWEVVAPSVAERDLTYLTYIDEDKVLSKSVPKTDPRKLRQLQLKRRNETDSD